MLLISCGFLVNQQERLCHYYEEAKDFNYSGTIHHAYLDTLNHNFRRVDLESGKTVYLNIDRSGLFEYLEPGDSIVKTKGSYEVLLFRNDLDTAFLMDYGCNQ